MKTYKIQPLDLMQYINTKYHEPFIHELIEFEGSLDCEKLILSINQLIEIFPLLKCSYDSKSNSYIENDNIMGKDLLVIDNQADKTKLLLESLDLEKRLIKFTLSKNFLVITISHLICDGNGFKNLIYILCDYYNGKEVKYANLMNREFSQLTKNVKVTTSTTLKMIFSMIGGYKNTKLYEHTEDEYPCLVEQKLSSEIMSNVHKFAKIQNATLNDVFLTAYARAIYKLYSKTKINIPCTVDLRKYATEECGIVNLTGTYNLNVKLSKKDTFSESLTKVSYAMNKQKKTKNDIAGPMLLVSKYEKSSLDKFLKLYGGMNTSAYTDYTNLGKLDENRLIFAGTTIKNAVGYSGLNKAPCFQIAISSYKGATTISSMFVCGETQANRAKELIRTIAEEIKAFGEKNN
ncbi:MAG: hypothetical protein K2H06_06110 [Anaeroplasmataceae bacterium]|nr:hypothetical protein [Anaeroplasmataceae bacterium]